MEGGARTFDFIVAFRFYPERTTVRFQDAFCNGQPQSGTAAFELCFAARVEFHAPELTKLFKDDREGFEKKWDDIGVFVKYGIITDEKFSAKAMDFSLLQNTEGKYFTLEEYKTKVKDNQTDKYDRMVALYTPSPELHTSYIRHATDMGYDVLHLYHVIDNHFIQHLEYKGDKMTFVRVDSDTPDHLIQKEEKKDSVLSEKEQEKVKEIFTSLSGVKDHQLIMRAMTSLVQKFRRGRVVKLGADVANAPMLVMSACDTAAAALESEAQRHHRLCELNVIAQVHAVREADVVKQAWRSDQPVMVHGWIYDLREGLLRDLDLS